jgi:hypothetical protein
MNQPHTRYTVRPPAANARAKAFAVLIQPVVTHTSTLCNQPGTEGLHHREQ